ncbi:hypothetical protein [Chryseobacterium sp. MFBS3-17]|uniref:hypothetical protein n=1 Tax=Chryseobacterium sp. MFBS3-17 TaxID=2886689 RepID=UPI001D0F1D03|nr:hypothetical protein [Chryseobacterium sp. MFBS3-17]MCC2590916.1 hypothetical protein [Chryseobacterium sp. MFBS3-17]
MIRIILRFYSFCLYFVASFAFSQHNKNDCPEELSYFAYSLPMDGIDWFVPIKYQINKPFIDLKIKKESKEELFIRFKIIETLKCDFEDINNSNLKYTVLIYDEDTDTFGENQSEIEFKFSNGKGVIFIRHPSSVEIVSEATVIH